MIISSLEECKKNKERINVYIDGEFAFACYKDTAVENGIARGKEFLSDEIELIRQSDAEMYAIQFALKYVSSRQRTQQEVERKLKEINASSEHIDSAIDKLIEYGYLDDADFAKQLSEELARRYAKKMVFHKLLQKGIGKEIAQEVTANIDDMPLLKELAERQRAKYSSEPEQKARQKQIRSLMQKGFDYGDIQSVVDGEYYED